MNYLNRTYDGLRNRRGVGVDFTEVLLMVGLAMGAKALGLW